MKKYNVHEMAADGTLKTYEESVKREVKTKTGNVKVGRLAPVVVHDNRSGPYNIGRNEYKRKMKALREEVKAKGGDPTRLFKRKPR